VNIIKALIKKKYDKNTLPLNERLAHLFGGFLLLFLSLYLQFFMLKSMVESFPKASSPIIAALLWLFVISSLFGIILWSCKALYEGVTGEKLVLNKQTQLAKDNRAKKATHIYEHWITRYLIALTITSFTYYLYINTGINWIGISVLMLIACWYALEVTMYALGLILICGASYALYLLVVALPVSVAIIVGALIIAVAIKRR